LDRGAVDLVNRGDFEVNVPEWTICFLEILAQHSVCEQDVMLFA
jgi:hypothetical protein